AWLTALAHQYDSELTDLSADWCLFAVQGPEAFARLRDNAAHPPDTLGYYAFTESEVCGVPAFVARTGYTGEPGCEVAVPVAHAREVWARLTGQLGLHPIGLAARDTLRLEACMALYGHELREEWHPFESGLGWTIDLEQEDDFIGKKALLAIRGVGYPYRLVGVEVTGRGIPREGYPVLHQGDEVGHVTSGALSPTTGRSIALARIRAEAAKIGTPLEVSVRDKPVAAEVVRRPFYKNPALRA
nr:glycine cleavage system aminomethyltransferase GcvT [Gammaproteobacteria bacterium]NIR98002.1 glycine cleavage system aminomethyltransferase GcvT [Gammaproteobacteria bacterium]NIT63697.1 glycine cleavage system aminomethyltransferase GcvT [Gammaproteobacteria bacterium]NIV20656.1 glycine cleavage system aminomethyltransferase GcvT [Gammaproteobacteria bacterium]NIY32277.1 glycine cleavage system aminomethyltransferase GcvT [Gammaproteobacteria bacterium]